MQAEKITKDITEANPTRCRGRIGGGTQNIIREPTVKLAKRLFSAIIFV